MKSRKTLKRYKEGNITAAFGTDLTLCGTTSIPNLLLRYYTKIEITDEEMMVLVQLLRLRTEEKILFPPPEMLAECLAGGLERVERNLASLLEKEVITVTQYYDEAQGTILAGYDFEPLFAKLSEAWACAKVKEIEKTRKVLGEREEKGIPEADLTRLTRCFEEEFGRPLSPMEVEQIRLWVRETDCALVLDALRRAVLIGKHNFKYIDGILLKWKKNNLRTLDAVAEYDRNFQDKRQKKNGSAKESRSDKASSRRKKEMVKALYLS
ncbi:MAG: DnaD domain protein [Bacillota bacterium]